MIMSSSINFKTSLLASAAPLLASFLGNRVCAGFGQDHIRKWALRCLLFMNIYSYFYNYIFYCNYSYEAESNLALPAPCSCPLTATYD